MYRNRLGFLSLTTIIFFILLGFITLEIYFYKSTDFKSMKIQREDNFKDYPIDAKIKIGVVWPFFLEEGDNYFKEGILLALEEINQKTVLGREVEVVFKDDKWDIDEAFDIAYDFANDKDIIAVIAHDDAELAIPASMIYEHANVIMISPAVSDPMLTRDNFDYIFRNTPSDIDIGMRLASLSAQMSIKKVIIYFL
jgi:branched-chain amino acid transport system substrate-binding protein